MIVFGAAAKAASNICSSIFSEALDLRLIALMNWTPMKAKMALFICCLC